MLEVKQLGLILFLSAFCLVLSKPSSSKEEVKCGYASCHPVDPNKLNVHLVPHSHDDLGWLKTVDQYYYGNKIQYQKGVRGVQYIIDSVVQALQENPDRKFIQVETAFFAQWWEHQDDDTKQIVKDLVNSGQLEMIGGGWSMNDEAVTNYQAVIDQFTLGLRFLHDLFGTCGKPKVGWQIDPFGHTNEMASIFAKLGYDGLLFTRIDYRDSDQRQKTKNTEFVWRGSPSLGNSSDIFTSLIYRFYNAPDHFCWDVQCGDTPIIEDEESPEYNVEDRVNKFNDYILNQSSNYPTNNILITMGGDFTFQAASMYYINMDRLIKGFKKFKPEVNIIYSTPSCYLKAVNEAAIKKGIKFNLKTDDFMPYASDKHSYWTGYYTSRPNSKRFERLGNNLLQISKQLMAFGKARNKDYENDLVNLKKVMGIMQHHDAITGTEKQHVANDYVRMLTTGVTEAQAHTYEIIPELLLKQTDSNQNIKFYSCLLSNISNCEQSSVARFAVTVYNPSSHRVTEYIRLPVTSIAYKVVGIDGQTIPHQITPSIDSFNTISGKKSLYELVFQAKDLPPLGLKYYYIVKEDTINNSPNLIQPTPNVYDFGTKDSGFSIDKSTGLLKSISKDGTQYLVKQEFLYYSASNGTNKGAENRASGAYVFRPNVKKPNAILISSTAEIKAYTGNLFDEVHQTFNKWIKQVIRIYKEEKHVEFDWVVGPIEYIDKLGVEVITRFTTDLKSNKIFYTDSNGRSLIKRVRNHRDTFTYTNEEPVSGNYYPVTSRIVLKEEERKLQFAVLNDRPQGGSSLEDGVVELMIHRRLTNDDDFGVGEVLNEVENGKGVIVRGQHHVILSTNKEKSAAAEQKSLVHKKQIFAPWPFVGDATAQEHSQDTLSRKVNFEFSGLTKPLPDNVQILTLENRGDNILLLRLEHTYEINEDETLSKPVTVDLNDIFQVYVVKSVRETTLGNNWWIEDNVRLTWPIESGQYENAPKEDANIIDFKIPLNPMEIRTLSIEVEPIVRSTGGGANSLIPQILVTITMIILCLMY